MVLTIIVCLILCFAFYRIYKIIEAVAVYLIFRDEVQFRYFSEDVKTRSVSFSFDAQLADTPAWELKRLYSATSFVESKWGFYIPTTLANFRSDILIKEFIRWADENKDFLLASDDGRKFLRLIQNAKEEA